MRRKIALITGASRGIGAAIAKKLAAQGYGVAVNYCVNAERAQAVVEEIIAAGGVAKAFCADVADTEAVNNLFIEVRATLGNPCVLVNNAAINAGGLFTDTNTALWQRAFAVNVYGVMNCTKAAVPDMVSEKSGRIINITSMWGEVGASCESVYSATKGAVIAFTKAMAKELAPSGITVNAVSPGVINTEMNSALDADTMKALAEETPLGRLGTAEDVANCVVFLSGENASFVTGQILGCNGGFVI